MKKNYGFSWIIWFTPLWQNLKLGVIYASFLRQICTPKISDFTKTKVLSQSGPEGINGRYDYGQRSIIFFFSHLPLSSPLLLTYLIILCIKTNYYIQKIRTTFIKEIARQIDFKRPVFAMTVLQASFSLTHWLTDSSFSYGVSHVTCYLSGVSIFLEGLVSMELATF